MSEETMGAACVFLLVAVALAWPAEPDGRPPFIVKVNEHRYLGCQGAKFDSDTVVIDLSDCVELDPVLVSSFELRSE